nr:class I SAM-dependent methyltransferase [Endozoicomonas sp. OPT23]
MNHDFSPLNQRVGFTFNTLHVLLKYWLDCWDGSHPLLDIGCGNCLNSLQAAETGARVIATELNPKVIPELKEQHRGTGIEFDCLHLPETIPFKDETFSGILCAEVFHFLDHEEVLASIQRFYDLLIPGGKVILTTVSEDLSLLQPVGLKQLRVAQRERDGSCMKALREYQDLFCAARNLEPEGHPAWEIYAAHLDAYQPGYFNFFYPEQLATAFKRQGFDIELIELGAANHYPIWKHGPQDQVRLVAGKPE